MKERAWVAVSGVKLQPDCRQLSLLEPGPDKGRLSCSGHGGKPYACNLPRDIQVLKQPLAQDGTV